MSPEITRLLKAKTGDCICIDSVLMKAIREMADALEYRYPASVTEYVRYPQNIKGFCEDFEICPKCGLPINRTYQEFCSDCGQHLEWNCHKLRQVATKLG